MNGGVLHLVLNHPAFRVPKESAWGFDDEKKVQFRRVDRYLSELKMKLRCIRDKSAERKPFLFIDHFNHILKRLKNPGLLLGGWKNGCPIKQVIQGLLSSRKSARAEFPIFLYLSVQKI